MHTKTQQSYEFTPRKANFFKAFSHMKRAQVIFLQALHRNYLPIPNFTNQLFLAIRDTLQLNITLIAIVPIGNLRTIVIE